MRIRAFVWVFLLFLLQNGISFLFPHPAPPFLLIGVIFYSFLEGPLFGFIIGAFSGVFLEIFQTGAVGFHIGSMGLLGALSGFVSRKIFRESLWIQALYPAAANFGVTLIGLLAFRTAWQEPRDVWGIGAEALLLSQPVLVAVFSPIIFWILNRKAPA